MSDAVAQQKLPKVPWTVTDAVLAVVVFIVIQTAGGVLIFLFGQAPQVSSKLASTLGLLAIYGLQVGFLWFLAVVVRKAGAEELGIRPFNVSRGVGLAVIFYIGLAIITVIYGAIAEEFGIRQPQDMLREIVRLFGRDAAGFALAVLFIAIIAPVVEELFFRGVVYAAIRKRWGVAPGLVISSVLFAILHLTAYTLLPIALIGIALAYLYEKTGSLGPPIILHALNNFLSVVLLYYSGIFPGVG